MAAILDKKVTFFPASFFGIITCSISIKNHIQLEKSILQVVTELDFWFQIYFFLKNFFTSQIYFMSKLCAIINCHRILQKFCAGFP